MSDTPRYGLVGLGQMGLPVCERLATVGEVFAFDLNPERLTAASRLENVSTTSDLRGIAGCSRIVLSLPSPEISQSVIDELAPRLSAGTIVIESSTVLPSDVRNLDRSLRKHNASAIDAAILSGVAQMSAGRATLLVGGDREITEQVEEILAAMGPAGVEHFGPVGSGMAAKVVNNGVAHAVMVVLSEAFAMARSQDIELAQIAEMLSRPDGGLRRPLEYRMMDRVARGDFAGGMPLDAARKDSKLALALAQENAIPLFATQGAHTAYELAMAEGLGREDYAAIASLWEKWIGQDLRFGEAE